MTELLSAGNSRVKAARKLLRRPERAEQHRFLLEGWKNLQAARDAGGDRVLEVFATSAAAAEHDDLLAGLRVHLVDDRALASLADAQSPQGLVAVCEFLDLSTPPDTSLQVICADVRDPGNAGTVIRTADAAGVGSVVLAGQSVDPYNPKTVRASVGSLFHVPLTLIRDVPTAIADARAAGRSVLAADGAGELDLDQAIDAGMLRAPTTWLFGNEAWGLPREIAELADHRVSIPIHGQAESLNLATAAAVCLYASARAQRR